MRLRPLSKVAERSAAGSLRIRCVDCGAVIPYKDAQERGWGFDLDGRPYEAFYCDKDAGARMGQRIAAHVRVKQANEAAQAAD